MTRHLSYEILNPNYPTCSLCHLRAFRGLRCLTVKSESFTARIPICSDCITAIVTGVKGTNANEHLSIATRDRSSHDRQSPHRLRRGRNQ